MVLTIATILVISQATSQSPIPPDFSATGLWYTFKKVYTFALTSVRKISIIKYTLYLLD